MALEVQHCSLARNGREILSNVSFSVEKGECVVIRGKNGAGKSTILSAIMGFDDVEIVKGDILLDGESLCDVAVHDRAKRGIFLAHQEPPAIDGVTLAAMARMALEAIHGINDVPEAQHRIREALTTLGLPDAFAQKVLHADMSGGEKKRAELFQLVLLHPKYALLDELDSGLDAASTALAVSIIAKLRSEGTGFVVVTHSDAFAHALAPSKIIDLSL